MGKNKPDSNLGEGFAFVQSGNMQDFFVDLLDQARGVDRHALNPTKALAKNLEEICKVVKERISFLDSWRRYFLNDFGSSIDAKDSSVESFFYAERNWLSQIILTSISEYSSISRDYEVIAPYFEGEKLNKSPALSHIINETRELSLRSISEFIRVTVDLPKVLDIMYKNIASLNNYLRKRFIKSEDDGKSATQKRIMMFNFEDDALPIKYVKIKLIDNNPLLTEFLLDIIEDIPKYDTKSVESKQNGRKVKKNVRSVSSYGIDQVAERIILLSNQNFLNCLHNSRQFFQEFGDITEQFYNLFFSKMKNPSQHLIESTPVRMSMDQQILNELNSDQHSSIQRKIRKIKRAGFDNIIQNDDDVLPSNRKEIDYFKYRNELIDLIYSTIKKLSKINDSGKEDVIDNKETIARQAVLKAIDIKAQMNELLVSQSQRKLRFDKETDNEYYVGSQGDIGMFQFERAPTPNVKLEEVIGSSFDDAKRHLNEIVGSAAYPHVMRLSAPGGKLRNNILLLGPYGCGKTELGRAICGDPRVIGASVSVAGTLTAYMHESVNNIKRLYDAAKKLYIDGRELKPVVLVLDEFNAWFSRSGHGFADVDMQQIENVLLEILDGMNDYNGIITMAMTNKPWEIPRGIIRRFRYVDIVGQLSKVKRVEILRLNLEKSFPLSKEVNGGYMRWAEKLNDTPGDVVRKVVDEIHFNYVPDFLKRNPSIGARLQRTLQKREQRNGRNSDEDTEYLRDTFSKYFVITPEIIDKSVDSLILKPHIVMQIRKARRFYERSRAILDQVAQGESAGFGLKTRDTLYDLDDEDKD